MLSAQVKVAIGHPCARHALMGWPCVLHLRCPTCAAPLIPSLHRPAAARTRREPLYCNADGACWWELVSLASHAHPSVAAMARTLMSGQPVLYDGDPLKDHGLTAFLDKFLQVRRRRRGTQAGGEGGRVGGKRGPQERLTAGERPGWAGCRYAPTAGRLRRHLIATVWQRVWLQLAT